MIILASPYKSKPYPLGHKIYNLSKGLGSLSKVYIYSVPVKANKNLNIIKIYTI